MGKPAGVNESEEKINSYCKKLFLNLWTVQNPYKKDRDELCDTLIICGNKVIIFSVKKTEFMDASEFKGIEKMSKDIWRTKSKKIKIEWERWHRKVMEKSKRQLIGAKRWLKTNPSEVYTDASCETVVPFLRVPDNPQFYLITIVDGLSGLIKSIFDEEKGTFCLSSQEPEVPMPGFIKADINEDGSFIHVFEEDALSMLFEELDTISDLMDYLDERERFWRSDVAKKKSVIVTGEEEFLGLYFKSYDPTANKYRINLIDIPTKENSYEIVMGKGSWNFYQNKIRADRQRRNKDSYAVDAFINRYGDALKNDNIISNSRISNKDVIDTLEFLVLEKRINRRGITDMINRGANLYREDKLDSAYYRSHTFCMDDNNIILYLFLQINKYPSDMVNKNEYESGCFISHSVVLKDAVEKKLNYSDGSNENYSIDYAIGFVSSPIHSMDDFINSARLLRFRYSKNSGEKERLTIEEAEKEGHGIKNVPRFSTIKDFE